MADIFATRARLLPQPERAVLRELRPCACVVATGGARSRSGEPAGHHADCASRLAGVSFETVLDRIPADGRRPLAADRTSMQALYRIRRSAYEHAHLRLDADRAPGELVDRILEWLGG